MKSRIRILLWKVLNRVNHWDYALLLPNLARLPIGLGFWLAQIRGQLKARLLIDWRSMALGHRHIAKQSQIAYHELFFTASFDRIRSLLRQRFEAEAQDEYDAQLIAKNRFNQLQCTINSQDALAKIISSPRGVLLLTLHHDSFYLGSLFVAQAGRTVNIMSSSVTHHPLVDPAVQTHFSKKYRGSEPHLHGGQVLNMEEGLRPFYRMLENKQILMMLADAPALPSGAGVDVFFLGKKRHLAGGALRLAMKTNSLMAAYVCRCTGPGQYAMQLLAPQEPSLGTLNAIYQFLGNAILQDPGRWWAIDLLPQMPIVQVEPQR
jgi:lauroyl/myristoyl acyltransferase